MAKRAVARVEQPMENNGQCSVFHLDRQCPFPGVWGDSPKGNPVLFCHWHSRPENRRSGVVQQEFFDIYAKDAQCVEDTLELWYPNWRQERLQEIQEQHPEWQRRDDETKSQYVARMRQVAVKIKGR